jgi:hypothetical protein
VPPWVLIEQPAAYTDFALMTMSAEAYAEKQKKGKKHL